MEGMEDITNFFTGVATPGEGENLPPEVLDRKKLELIKKLNFRAREPSMVYKHRRSQERLDLDLTNYSGSIGDLFFQ